MEVNDGRAGSLAAEIISLVDAFDPETCAREWMEKSGIVSPSGVLALAPFLGKSRFLEQYQVFTEET